MIKELLTSYKYAGLTIFGDNHGNYSSLTKVVSHAMERNYFILSLGDLVDYGDHSIDCVNFFYELVLNKKALLVIGNHEYKIYRYLKQYIEGDVKVNLSDSNKATTEKLFALPKDEFREWVRKFFYIVENSRYHYVVKNDSNTLLFVHGAASNSMVELDNLGKLKSLALYGQTNGQINEAGFPVRIYDWVDRLDSHLTVFVGHDIRSRSHPIVQVGNKGGMVHFMDTGCSKSGFMSSADFSFDGNNLSFNNYDLWKE